MTTGQTREPVLAPASRADDASARSPRAGRPRVTLRRLEPALVILVLLAAWELLSRTGVLSREDFPPVTAIASSFFDDVQTTALWDSVAASIGAWLVGMAIVIAVGIPAGLLLGASSLAYRASHFTLEFIRTIPSIAALPLLMFVYGVSFQLTLMLVVLTALWPLLIQTMYGMHDVDPVTRDTGKAYGLGRIRRLAVIDIPSCTPYMATGLRISGILGLILAIGASLIAGGKGLGALIAQAANNGDTEVLYARLFLTSALGLVVTYGLIRLERRALRWHPSQRETAL